MTNTLLRYFQAPENQHLLSCFRRVKIPRGKVLRERDRRGPDIALVVSGQIRAALCNEGQELTIFNVTRGHPVMTNSTLVLRAREDTELLITTRQTFLELLSTSPELVWPTISWMEMQLTRTLHIIEGIRFLSVRARLIRFIIDLCIDCGRDVLDGTSVPFEYTIEDVANEIGASRQSTSQIFNELIKEKYMVRVSRTQLIVPSLSRLANALREADAPSLRLAATADQRSSTNRAMDGYLRKHADLHRHFRDGTHRG